MSALLFGGDGQPMVLTTRNPLDAVAYREQDREDPIDCLMFP
jgi:hypothetical protein